LKLQLKLQFLDLSNRRYEHNQITARVKGPLYSASAFFERAITIDRWVVEARAEASLPFGKKWNATLFAEGALDLGALAKIYREKTSTRETTIEWRRVLYGSDSSILELDAEGSTLKLNIAAGPLRGEVPIVTAAELLFLIQDTWKPEGGPKSFFVIAGRKFYAVSLTVQNKGTILGSIAPADLWTPDPDWQKLLNESLGSQAREFQFGWDEGRQCLVDLKVKVPLLGNITVNFI
jgi:hypothetical protein